MQPLIIKYNGLQSKSLNSTMMDWSKNLMYIMVRKIAEGRLKVIRCLLKKAGFDNTLRIQLIYSLFSIGLYK